MNKIIKYGRMPACSVMVPQFPSSSFPSEPTAPASQVLSLYHFYSQDHMIISMPFQHRDLIILLLFLKI